MRLIYGLLLLLLCPCALTATYGDSTGTQAYRIADMMERFGANIFPSDAASHNYGGAYPSDFTASSVIAGLQWLTGNSGLTIRLRVYYINGTSGSANYHYNLYTTYCPTIYAATGSRFSFAVIGDYTQVPSLVSLIQLSASTSPNSLGWAASVEGVNEPNDVGARTANFTLLVQKTLWTAVRAQARLRVGYNVTVIQTSIVAGFPRPDGYISSFINTSLINPYASHSNMHFYPPYNPDLNDGYTRQDILNDALVGWNNEFANQPIDITEYHPTLFFQQAAFKLNPVYDAYFGPMFFLQAYRKNFETWYWYALLDYANVYYCGLFNRTGGVAPRNVAYSIRAMYTLTGDTGSTKNTFTTGFLNYSISGLPLPLSASSPYTGGNSMLFQNSSGTFFLYVWNSQAAPGGNVSTITIHFNGNPVTKVSEYIVSNGVSTNTIPVQTLTNAKTLTAQLAASVHLYVIQSSTSAAATTSTTTTSAKAATSSSSSAAATSTLASVSTAASTSATAAAASTSSSSTHIASTVTPSSDTTSTSEHDTSAGEKTSATIVCALIIYATLLF